jgi:hypothetical protein
MPGLILFLCCTGFCGWRVAVVLAGREPEPLTAVEHVAWTGILICGLWIAQGNLLSFVGAFSPAPLLASSLVLVALVAGASRYPPLAALWPSRPRRAISDWPDLCRHALGRQVPIASSLAIALAGLAVIYSVAALAVLPVSNHDALSYHFPKAMWLVTTRAFGLYPSQDLRVTYSPGNYEMLVGTFMTFLRTDKAAGLVTSVSLALFLATGFILFERVWRDTSVAALTVPVMLASPVLFLHVTSHKNDILIALFTLNAFIWLARFSVHGGSGSAIVGVVALALSAGTKYHGLFAVLASGVLLWWAWRHGAWRPTWRMATLQAACIALLFLALGSVQYLANLAATGLVTGIFQSPTPNALNTVMYPAYWQVPRFTWMFLLAPLVTEGQYFHVPWSRDTWFWPAYELYFSHYGIHVSLLILLLPFGVWWSRRRLDERTRRELTALSLAALVMTLLVAMIGLRPYGSFSFIPRFLFFALPVLLVWTWCPAIVWLERFRGLRSLAIAASLLVPIAYISITVTKDSFSPLEWVEELWSVPELRRDILIGPWRASAVVDRFALPDATVAVDGGYDGWSYPIFGAKLSRHVEVIMNDPGPYVPGPEVDWVAIDRALSIIWGHPDFQSMRVARRYIDQGPLTAADQRVYNSLTKNPDFRLVYFLKPRFQAVFQRIHPHEAGTLRAHQQYWAKSNQ